MHECHHQTGDCDHEHLPKSDNLLVCAYSHKSRVFARANTPDNSARKFSSEMVFALSIRHAEAGVDKAAHVWPTAGERRADRRFGWLPLHIIAICFVVLAHVVQGRTAESQVHRAFSHHVVAYIGASLHDAVGQRLAVCAQTPDRSNDASLH